MNGQNLPVPRIMNLRFAILMVFGLGVFLCSKKSDILGLGADEPARFARWTHQLQRIPPV